MAKTESSRPGKNSSIISFLEIINSEYFIKYFNIQKNTLVGLFNSFIGELLSDEVKNGFGLAIKYLFYFLILLLLYLFIDIAVFFFSWGVLTMVYAAFTIFPLLVVYIWIIGKIDNKKEPFKIKNIFIKLKHLTKSLLISGIDGILGAIVAFGFVCLIVLIIKLFWT